MRVTARSAFRSRTRSAGWMQSQVRAAPAEPGAGIASRRDRDWPSRASRPGTPPAIPEPDRRIPGECRVHAGSPRTRVKKSTRVAAVSAALRRLVSASRSATGPRMSRVITARSSGRCQRASSVAAARAWARFAPERHRIAAQAVWNFHNRPRHGCFAEIEGRSIATDPAAQHHDPDWAGLRSRTARLGQCACRSQSTQSPSREREAPSRPGVQVP